MLRHFFTRQFLGFLAAGGFAALFHWLSRIFLSLWLPFPWAVAIAYFIGMSVAFALNSIFVFPNSTRPRVLQARDFALVNLAFLPVVWAASIYLNYLLKSVGVARHSEEIAHAIAISLPLLGTFLIYKFIAFKGKPNEQ